MHLSAASPGSPTERELSLRWILFFVAPLAILYCGFITVLTYLRYVSFLSWTYEDNALFNNLISNTAQGRLLFTSIWNNAPYFDHVQPILPLFALIYRIYPHFVTMHFLFVTCTAVGGIFMFLIARHWIRDLTTALLVVCMYFSYHPLIQIHLSDGDPILFCMPFLLGMFYFYITDRLKLSMLFFLLAILCHEMVTMGTFMMAVMFTFPHRHTKKFRFLLAVMGISVFWFICAASINRIFGEQAFYYSLALSTQQEHSHGIWNILGSLARVPILGHLQFYLVVFLPFAFTVFLSRWILPALPMIAATLIQRDPMSNAHLYILMPVFPFFFIALADLCRICETRLRTSKLSARGAARVLRLSMAAMIAWNLVLMLEASAFAPPDSEKDIHLTPGVQSVDTFLDARLYTMNDFDRTAWKAIELIPEDASVASNIFMLQALSERQSVYPFRRFEVFTGEYGVTSIDYLLLFEKPDDIPDDVWPWSWQDDRYLARKKGRLKRIVRRWHYQRIFQERGFSVWKRRGPDRPGRIVWSRGE